MADKQEMPKQPLVPMIGPDGSSALIDAQEVHALMMRGAVPGVVMRSPDGRVGVVAFKHAEAAQNSGGTLLQNDGEPYPEGQTPVIVGHNGNGEPIWGTGQVPGTSGKRFFNAALAAVKGAGEGMLDARANAWEQAHGMTSPADFWLRPVERLAEGQAQEAENAEALAKQHEYTRAFGHGVASVLPLIGPVEAETIENYYKHLDEGDVAGALGELGGTAAVTAAMEAAPKGFAAARDLAKSIPARAAEAIAPEDALTQPQGQEQLSPRERAAAARRMGVNLDLAQATDAGVPRMVKRINEHSATAGPGYEQARQGNAQALEAEAQRMVHAVRDKDTNPLGAPMGREEFGHALQQAVKRHDAELRDAPGLQEQTQTLLDQAHKQDMTREEFGEAAQAALKKAQQSMYDRASEQITTAMARSGAKVPMGSVEQVADQIFTDNAGHFQEFPEALRSPGVKLAWDWVNRLKSRTAKPAEGEAAAASATPSVERTYSPTEVAKLRSELWHLYQSGDLVGSAAEGWLKQLTGSLDDALTNPENQRGMSPAEIQKFRAGTSTWARMKAMFDNPQSPFFSILRNPEAATAGETLTNLRPTAVRQFREAMTDPKVAAPELVGQQQRQAMQNLLDPTRSGELDFAGLPARFRKLDKEQAAEMFTPDQMDALGEIADKADVETPYDKAGSQLKTLRDAPDAAAASNAIFDSQGRSKLSQEEVRQLFEAAPEQMPHLQQQAMSRLLDPANNGTPDLAGLPTRWVRSNKDLAAHVMTPEQMRELDELSSVSRAAQYRSNPSGTAVTLQPAAEVAGAVSGAASGVGTALSGHPLAGAATAAAVPAEMAAQAVAGKAMRSPGIVESVMEHEKPPSVAETVGNAMTDTPGILSRAANPAENPGSAATAAAALAGTNPGLRDKFAQQVERRNAQGQSTGVSTPPNGGQIENINTAEPNEVHDPAKEAAVLASLSPTPEKSEASAPVAPAKPAPAGTHSGTDGVTLQTGTSTSEQQQMEAPEGATHEVVHPQTGQVIGHMVNGEYVPLENGGENASSAP